MAQKEHKTVFSLAHLCTDRMVKILCIKDDAAYCPTHMYLKFITQIITSNYGSASRYGSSGNSFFSKEARNKKYSYRNTNSINISIRYFVVERNTLKCMALLNKVCLTPWDPVKFGRSQQTIHCFAVTSANI